MSQPLPRVLSLLRERKDELMRQWTSRIRDDPKIPQARALDAVDLRDYTPKLLEGVIDSLAQSARPAAPGGASGQEIGSSEAAKVHASHRLARRYSLAEELRELGALCSVIIDMLARERVPLGDGEAELVHSALDEVMVTAAVEVERTTSAEEPVLVELRGQALAVVLEVSNRGSPIPPELLPVIFDPFRRGEQQHEDVRPSKGLGLGLFIAKAIVDAHGGSIEVTSTPEQGTTFRVMLPRPS